jgi:hypothetical protein
VSYTSLRLIRRCMSDMYRQHGGKYAMMHIKSPRSSKHPHRLKGSRAQIRIVLRKGAHAKYLFLREDRHSVCGAQISITATQIFCDEHLSSIGSIDRSCKPVLNTVLTSFSPTGPRCVRNSLDYFVASTRERDRRMSDVRKS